MNSEKKPRTVNRSTAINYLRREQILAILSKSEKPMSAYQISLAIQDFVSTGTTICRLQELRKEGKIENIGNNQWQIK